MYHEHFVISLSMLKSWHLIAQKKKNDIEAFIGIINFLLV